MGKYYLIRDAWYSMTYRTRLSYTDDVEEVRRLFEFLGLLNGRPSTLRTPISMSDVVTLLQDDREDWAAYIREWDIPLNGQMKPWNTLLSASRYRHEDVQEWSFALVWLLDSMPSHQSEKLTRSQQLSRENRLWEEDFNEKIVTYIAPVNLLKGRTILRTFIMESFSKAVALWCFQKCGREVMKEPVQLEGRLLLPYRHQRPSLRCWHAWSGKASGCSYSRVWHIGLDVSLICTGKSLSIHMDTGMQWSWYGW
jgi:hypothetical protein